PSTNPAQVTKGGVCKVRPRLAGPLSTIFTVQNEGIAIGLGKIKPTHRPRKPRSSKESQEKPGTTESGQWPQQGWTFKEFRKQLAIGINEITRGLEKDELCLGLVYLSVKPDLMTQHLIDPDMKGVIQM
uniref:Uncharacterized protein n=1 Tax=Callorhinchus milii TaxID=7868 RepID=A0A4W3HKV9_CALMI